MVRVLHVLDSMGPGGAQAFIMNVYREIDRDKIQFDFLLHKEYENSYDDEVKQLGGKIYYLPGRRDGILKNKRALKEFFKEHTEYKSVHMHISSLTYIEPLIAAKVAGVKNRIVHSHNTRASGSKLHKMIHTLNKLRIERIATHFYACSDNAARWFYGDKGLYKKSKVIQNGINTDLYKASTATGEEYRKLINIGDAVVLGHIGRFSKVKNHAFLLDIFKAYHAKNSSSVLVLVGDGSTKEQIENKAKEYQLDKKVIFTGNRKDVPQLLQVMDVVVMPSHYEGFPVVLVEAQAASVPCVVSDVVTATVDITGGVEFCSLEDSAEKWSETIEKCLKKGKNPDWNGMIKKAGFDIKDVCLELSKTYTDI